MRFFKERPLHNQIILIPVSIMVVGILLSFFLVRFTYDRFDSLTENFTKNDMFVINKVSDIIVNIGMIHEDAAELLANSSKIEEETVYVESQKLFDRVRQNIAHIEECRITANYYRDSNAEEESENLSYFLVNRLEDYLNRLTSSIAMVTVDVSLSKKELLEAEGIYRDVLSEIEKVNNDLINRATLEFRAENLKVKNQNMKLLILMTIISAIATMGLIKYASVVSKKINSLNNALESLADGKDAEIPPLGDNIHMNRVISSLIKYRDTQRSLHKTMDELTDIKNNLENIVSDRTDKLRVYEEIFNNTDEAIFIADSSCSVLKVNRAFELITGYTAAEIQGKSIEILKSDMYKDDFYNKIYELSGENKSWSGEVWKKNKNGDIFPTIMTLNVINSISSPEIKHFVGIFHDISELKETERELENMAYYDYLTKIPNGNTFKNVLLSELKLAERHREEFSIFFIDLDGFKYINDNYGHAAGDEVLSEVAERLKRSVRESDLACRMGGDEFTAILKRVSSREELGGIADKIIRAVSQPIVTNRGGLVVKVSIGIAVYPYNGNDYDSLVSSADEAMYSAKKAGKDCYRFA